MLGEKLTTRHLDEILKDIDSEAELKEYLELPGRESPFGSFIEYYRSLPKLKNVVPADLYKLASIDRSYCYHIWDGTKTPGRDKILLLCIAAGLDNDETRRALEAGGEAVLYPRSRRDCIIAYSIRQGLDVFHTNRLLNEAGLDPLK